MEDVRMNKVTSLSYGALAFLLAMSPAANAGWFDWLLGASAQAAVSAPAVGQAPIIPVVPPAAINNVLNGLTRENVTLTAMLSVPFVVAGSFLYSKAKTRKPKEIKA